MRTLFYIPLLLLSSCIFFSPPAERLPTSGLHFMAMGYDAYTLRVYEVTEKDAGGSLLRHDTLGLFSSGIKMRTSDSQYLEQWQFLKRQGRLFRTDTTRLNAASQGTGVNDSVLFMHPPRFDYLTVLQFCPYPYFRRMDKIGNTWDWDFLIGAGWAIDSLYPIGQVPDTFKIHYTYTDTLRLHTAQGPLFCHRITGKSISRFGTSAAIFYLNEQYGLVRYVAITIQQHVLELNLIRKGADRELMSSEDRAFSYWHPQEYYDPHIKTSSIQLH